MNHKLYNRDNDIFKLNLYLVAKKDFSWDKIAPDLEISKDT
jgi:hypothetical protein